MNKLVFFDLETSGLDKDRHAIVQIAAIAVTVPDFVEAESFEARIKFKAETASPAALALNPVCAGMFPLIKSWPETMDAIGDPEIILGLTGAVTRWNETALHPATAEKRLSDFLRRHATVGKVSKRTGRIYYVAQLAGHNVANFDMPFLFNWYQRLGQFMPTNFFALDTLNMALVNQAIGGIEYADLKLETLLQHHGIAQAQTHDAVDDVRHTAALAQMLYRVVRFDNEIDAKLNEASQKAQAILEYAQDANKPMEANDEPNQN